MDIQLGYMDILFNIRGDIQIMEEKIYIRNEEEEKQMGQKTAGRFNKGKIRYDLIPPWSLDQLAKVYTYGTRKYDDDNWWKGLKWKKDVFGCITRHIWKWMRGEKYDDESGLHHDYDVWLEKLAPHEPVSSYRHNVGEDNADAHMKRQIMGREVVVAVTDGQLDFGTWERIFYGEFDGRRRKRVMVKIIGA